MDTLHIRLSLVGSMFDFILRNTVDISNWAWLFVQLIYSGLVDPDNDQLLFTIIIDMLTVLIHHIISTEPNIESNKHYQSIIKKISKETKDFSDMPNTKAINFIRKLLPLNRSSNLEIMTAESSCTTASKTLANLLDKRRAFKFVRKEKVNTWELIEGVKNASALCLSWFGFSKLEKKMLRYEYQQRLLVRHKHMNIHRELSYLKDKPDVPNDMIELPEPTIIETVKKEQKCTMNTSGLKQPVMNLSINSSGIMSGDQIKSHVNSPANISNAEIVVLGSSVPNQMDMMMQPHNQMTLQANQSYLPGQPGQVIQQPMPHQMINQPMPQNHSQIMNRLHNQMQHQQHMQQQYPGQGMIMNGNTIQMQPDRKGLMRQISGSEKQKSANPSLAKKQKSTTPRKNNPLKNTANPQVSSMPGMQTGMSIQPGKMGPQAQQYMANQTMPGQCYAPNQQGIPRPMGQNPSGMIQPSMGPRMPTPANQSSQYYPSQQNSAQFQQSRMPQPGQTGVPVSMPQAVNRMPYQPMNPGQNQIRKAIPDNKPMAGYPNQMNQTRPILSQGPTSAVQGQSYQTNAQMYSQVKQQTSIPAARTVTPDPLAKQSNPTGAQNFINAQQAPRFPNHQTAQLQQKQAQQQRLFNNGTPPNNAGGMQIPTQPTGQTQIGQNWQQPHQRTQTMQRQAQTPITQHQQYQSQYIHKQQTPMPMNVQSSQQQQQQQYMQQQQQQQRVSQPQQQSQQFHNY